MCIFPAHIRTDIFNAQETAAVQTAAEHCRAASDYAKEALDRVGLGQTAALAGLLHDCGKFTRAFSDYLWAAYQGEDVRRGSVNHTFAGVQYLLEHYHQGDTVQMMASELIAYAVGAHHGLFDLMKDGKEYGFPHRQQARGIGCEEAIHNFLTECADSQELDRRMAAAVEEVGALLVRMGTDLAEDEDSTNSMFYMSMLSRLILSAVIEGDRRDTASFMCRISYPAFPENRTELWQECLAYMEQKLGEFPCRTPIQKARNEISLICRKKADEPGGIYRLNVPTGGGKTLASLRYALAHAARYGKKRIILTVPLLSIIDQNSKVIREYLPRQDILLEHHSNVVRSNSADKNHLDPWELLAENWSAPIVLTTLVQFLYTLFSGKTTAIRRFQALCDSVIVFDEVQTVPPRMLSLFNLAISFLANYCGATIVLCSATQPSLAQAEHPILANIQEMVPYNPALWAPFRRTHMEAVESRPLEEIPAFLNLLLQEHRSLLVVCNKKAQAEHLYQALAGKVSHLFHLSASMCMAHRRETLEQLTDALRPESGIQNGILCISTQVIEAGVDISFGCVVRLLAGMDSAVQAAGRCNRNGESSSPAPVYLLRCSDEKLPKALEEMRDAQNATLDLLWEFQQSPQQFREDLASDESICFYYDALYRKMAKGAQDFPLGKGQSILGLLSMNSRQMQAQTPYSYYLHQDFQTAGQKFQVFEENTTDVLVPYGAEGREIYADLCSERAQHDFDFVQKTLERAKPYTISIFDEYFEKLSKQGALRPVCEDRVYVLCDDYYNSATGLSMDPWANPSTEVNLCNIQML